MFKIFNKSYQIEIDHYFDKQLEAFNKKLKEFENQTTEVIDKRKREVDVAFDEKLKIYEDKIKRYHKKVEKYSPDWEILFEIINDVLSKMRDVEYKNCFVSDLEEELKRMGFKITKTKNGDIKEVFCDTKKLKGKKVNV